MTMQAQEDPPRLFDLAVEWPLQYVGESTLFEAGAYPGMADRLGQVDGYFSATAAAIVWFGSAPGEGNRPDDWANLGHRMTRIEAEFSGRLLINPSDLDRFEAEPPGAMTWAIAGLRGCAALLQESPATDRLAALLTRGVRAVRLAGLVDHPAGSAEDRALSGPERQAIELITQIAPSTMLVDLSGLSPRAAEEALDAIEATGGALLPLLSQGGGGWEGMIAGLRPTALGRLRALGGVVGLGIGRAFHQDAESLTRSIELVAEHAGSDCVAIGTGFLGIAEPIEGIGTASALLEWLSGRFDPEAVRAFAGENARGMLQRVMGMPSRSSPGA